MNPQTTEVQVEFVLRHILIVPKDGKEEFVSPGSEGHIDTIAARYLFSILS